MNAGKFSKDQEHRRSERTLQSVPVLIRGRSAGGNLFEERTQTQVVSANGALVVLTTTVMPGQELVIFNLLSREQKEGRVAYIGQLDALRIQVGIAFLEPCPEFWPEPGTPEN